MPLLGNIFCDSDPDREMQGLKFSTWNQSSTSKVNKMDGSIGLLGFMELLGFIELIEFIGLVEHTAWRLGSQEARKPAGYNA